MLPSQKVTTQITIGFLSDPQPTQREAQEILILSKVALIHFSRHSPSRNCRICTLTRFSGRARAISPSLIGKRVTKKASDTRKQCRIVACLST